MPSTTTSEAWDRFQVDMKKLAAELQRNYADADDQKKAAEVRSSLHELARSADAFFDSLGVASRDPEVRASTKQAARSFGSALAETFRELGNELDKALKQPAATK